MDKCYPRGHRFDKRRKEERTQKLFTFWKSKLEILPYMIADLFSILVIEPIQYLICPEKNFYVNRIFLEGPGEPESPCVIGLYKRSIFYHNEPLRDDSSYYIGAKLIGYFTVNKDPYVSNELQRNGSHIEEVKLKRPKRFYKLYIPNLWREYKLVAKNRKEAWELFCAEEWTDEWTGESSM